MLIDTLLFVDDESIMMLIVMILIELLLLFDIFDRDDWVVDDTGDNQCVDDIFDWLMIDILLIVMILIELLLLIDDDRD